MKYCIFCGRELIFKSLLDGSKENYCSNCNHVFFDAPSPAIIVAVIKSNKILLARSVGWKHPYWGLIAGHVKSGETAEKTVIREVLEEVGLEIFNLKFLGTYTKKRNNLLMIGFVAEAKSISVSKSKELEKAVWFKLNGSLPLHSDSIAAQIVKQIKISNLK